ncbi:MAG: TIGR02453 family protein [Lysobacterales bacterium 69-70]|nr:DUF2461 domain-containing protein [Xanthomonadaceae bacterium]ODU35041.1 MAG: TIGR02453 family protein [Xanthomonadaceae bacterium SCN 69-320]ODV20306.1 MAG: TIGR02453 family protein [Xanthomonadaceae bacterium SCN 69-25]OJY95298.1 MAG: TIGR02453 family protein [Xanthomonadales bacterium 69-70]
MSACFTPATFGFLRDLARNNNREWFLANKARYEEQLRTPFLNLLGELQAPLARISPHYRADTRSQGGSLFRQHRDTRFSNDKTPYKTWAGARLFHERSRGIEAPVFYLHLQPGGCFAGGGIWHPQSDALKKIREFLADNPAAWKKATQSKAFREHLTPGGETLTRPPRGFDPDHELIADIRRKDFVASAAFDDKLATSAEFKPWLIDTYKRLAPMVDYLCAALELDF